MDRQKELRRLVTAISNYKAVIEACRMLLELNVDPAAPYFRIFAAGIVVSYMRPFRRADGLGPLRPEYAKFPKDRPDLKALHEDLEKGRDWVFAHHSAKDSPSLLSPEKREAANEIIIISTTTECLQDIGSTRFNGKGIGFTR
jgi:hypothetical protein